MKQVNILIISIVLLSLVMSSLSRSYITEAAKAETLNIVIAEDEPAVVDRILYYALKRIGYNITMDAAGMEYAVKMTESGEKDGIAGCSIDSLELMHDNIIKVLEPISDVQFQVFALADNYYEISSWDDLSGLRVGCNYQRTDLINSIPEDAAIVIQADSFYKLNYMLLNNECDVIVAAARSDYELIPMSGVRPITILETRDSYIYLNKKYKHLAPLLAESIKAMKGDGTYDKIINNEMGEDNEYNVLHISSYCPEDIWDAKIKETIEKRLEKEGNINYNNVPLYSNRYHTDYERAKNAYSAIRTMFISEPPDVIIVSDNNAMTFTAHYYHILFKDIPVVFCAVDSEAESLWELKDNYTGIYKNMSIKENVDLILNLFPGTKKLYIINDCFENGKLFHDTAKK